MTEDWDARYANRAAGLWSGRANGALVQELSGVAPGRALDVGCGEGADAIWLALAGWRTTAVDVSAVAIERARAAAAEAGADVEWLVGDMAAVALTGFDLVSVQYPALPRAAADAIVGAVAHGGTLLVVAHADVDRDWAAARGIDIDAYVQPSTLRDRLSDGWTIEVDEVRPRVDVPEGAHHHRDLILRAARR